MAVSQGHLLAKYSPEGGGTMFDFVINFIQSVAASLTAAAIYDYIKSKFDR